MSRRILHLSAAMLLVLGPETAMAQTADEPPRAISLDEAVAMAQDNSPAAVAARGRERTATAGVRSAYAAFVPSVSVSAGASRRLPSHGATTRIENGQVVTLPDQPWSFSGGLGASVTLFEGGRRFFDLRSAKAQVASADANRTAQTYETALTVKQAWFNVLAARETRSASDAQLKQAEQSLRASIARVRARTATRSDSLRAEIQVANARLAIIDARNSLAAAEATLTREVGSAEPVTAEAGAEESLESASASPLLHDEAALMKMAEEGPAVRGAEAEADAARAGGRSAWTDYLPSVTASYSRSGSGVGTDFWNGAEDYTYGGSVRLSLSLPVFNQLQRVQRTTQARVAVQNAEASLRDARLAARADLTRALSTWRTADERIAILTASVLAAEEDLRVQEQRYAVGASTVLDVLTSEVQLDQARRDLIQGRYDLRIAKASIEAIVGRDL